MTKTKIVNLTPHDVTVKLETGEEFVFPATGEVARVQTVSKVDRVLEGGIPLVTRNYEEVVGLPEPKADTLYMVSLVVRQAAQELGREDVISPDTDPQSAIRDERGMIVAVRQFVI